jgi:hypothetical protein
MNWQKGVKFQINLFLLGFSAILILCTLKSPFYWDNVVQISVPANWYYQTDFRYFFLPDNIATGHPTFVGMYFAFLWKLFGRSLIVCHLGMLPFVFGLLFQLHKFLRNIGINNDYKVLIILGFIIFDPTFLSQLSLITFDIIQLFFFFLCINLILTRRNIAFGFFYMILTLISLRASIMAGGIFLFNILYDYYYMNKKIKPGDYFKYLPGILSLVIFLIVFKLSKGWVIHNSVSKAWQESGEFATFGHVLRNIGVFIWRLIDFGRIGVFAFFLLFIIKFASIRKFQDNTLKILFLIILTQFILFFPILIFSQNAFGHRYLLSIIIPAIILTTHWILSYKKLSSLWLTFTFIILVSGHFWQYPLKISQGWDATTLHWNYFNVSEKMNSYIKENKISKNEIGTFFPNRSSRYLTHIEEDENDSYSGVPFVNEYILYSNTFNVNDEVIDSLYSKNSNWKLIKKYSKNNIFMSLYHKE